MMHEHVLQGCQPEPLASYLKALGVLRLVAEQRDPKALGHWAQEGFVLSTKLDREELEHFFLDEYQPSPIVTPWNGGSGFFLKKGGKTTPLHDAILAIERSKIDRLSVFRAAIADSRRVLAEQGLVETPDSKTEKPRLIERLRDELADASLKWIDACLLISDGKFSAAPILGSGGNDGNLDFANNFHGRLVQIIELETGAGKIAEGLRNALFGAPSRDMTKSAIGFFDPKALGGANSSEGFGKTLAVNPWHYVLMLEGTLCFAAVSTRRLEASGPGSLSFPFTVHNTGSGYSSAASSDVGEGRKELWLPLWEQAASFVEIEDLFRQGRTQLGRKTVRNGLEFARALGALAGARGVTSFSRHGFHVRNGLSYLASPIGRWKVQPKPGLSLIDADLDRWISRFQQKRGKTAAAEESGRGIEKAMFDFARSDSAEYAQAILGELAKAELLVARAGLTKEVSPVPWLTRKWLSACDDNSVEYRLAKHLTQAWVERPGGASQARHAFRERRVPVEGRSYLRWCGNLREVTLGARGTLVNLIATIRRDDISKIVRQGPGARLADIADFIEGRISDEKLGRLIDALSLVRPGGQENRPRRVDVGALRNIPYAFQLAAVAYQRWGGAGQPRLHPTVGLVAAGGNGQSLRFTRLALGRLRASGWRLSVGPHDLEACTTQRITAALLFPLSDSQLTAFEENLDLGETNDRPSR